MCRHVKCRMLSTEGQFETIKGFKRIDLLNRKTDNIRVCPGWAISTMMTVIDLCRHWRRKTWKCWRCLPFIAPRDILDAASTNDHMLQVLSSLPIWGEFV